MKKKVSMLNGIKEMNGLEFVESHCGHSLWVDKDDQAYIEIDDVLVYFGSKNNLKAMKTFMQTMPPVKEQLQKSFDAQISEGKWNAGFAQLLNQEYRKNEVDSIRAKRDQEYEQRRADKENRRIEEEKNKRVKMLVLEDLYIKGKAPMVKEVFVDALKKYGMWSDVHMRTKGFINSNLSELTADGGYEFCGRNPSIKLPAIIKELRQKLTEAHLVSN